jgi:hypothetical protein
MSRVATWPKKRSWPPVAGLLPTAAEALGLLASCCMPKQPGAAQRRWR